MKTTKDKRISDLVTACCLAEYWIRTALENHAVLSIPLVRGLAYNGLGDALKACQLVLKSEGVTPLD